MTDLTKVSDKDLALVLEESAHGPTVQAEVKDEIERRKEELAKPFNPKTDVSADAKYLWKNILIWFWVVPAVAGLVYFLAMSLK